MDDFNESLFHATRMLSSAFNEAIENELRHAVDLHGFAAVTQGEPMTPDPDALMQRVVFADGVGVSRIRVVRDGMRLMVVVERGKP